MIPLFSYKIFNLCQVKEINKYVGCASVDFIKRIGFDVKRVDIIIYFMCCGDTF